LSLDRSTRVALLTNVLTPYRLPVYRDLANTPGWELRVMASRRQEAGFGRAHEGAFDAACQILDVELVKGLSFRRRVATNGKVDASQWIETHFPVGILPALARFRPDVIVSGELGARSALAALYSTLTGVPLVLWSYQSRSAAEAMSPLRRALARALITRARTVVGMGTQAREVLRQLGATNTSIFDAPNAHDREFLCDRLRAADGLSVRESLRAGLGCRERIALVAGRLVPAKGIRPLLASWLRLSPSRRRDWTLLFVGDGPLADEVRMAADTAAPGAIVKAPSVPPAQLVEFYAAADLLVFPSLGDPWGLVVNEALEAGLPVVCSSLAGCSDDLIDPGRNGWCFDPTDPGAILSVLAEALASPRLGRMGEAARDTAKRFGPEVMAGGLRRAITHALAS
jgi:glycosyltransferase involved in cell wall biosynthesis